MMQITPVVKQLLIINILFFIGTMAVPQAFDLLSFSFPESDDFRYWQFITSLFMHSNWTHLLFNMIALFSFGTTLENIWGSKKFLFFYFSCGLGASLLHLGMVYHEYYQMVDKLADLDLSSDTLHKVLNVNFGDGYFYRGDLFESAVRPVLEDAGKWKYITEDSFKILFDAAVKVNAKLLGASGAICGLLMAFGFMLPNAELSLLFFPIPIKAKYFVSGILAIDLFLGFRGQSFFGGNETGIAHFAHYGGAVIGFIMMWYWNKNSFNNRRWN
jgi:membrane associated rhomboid family serine protease